MASNRRSRGRQPGRSEHAAPMKVPSAQGAEMPAAREGTLDRMATIAAMRGESSRGPLSGGCRTSPRDRAGSAGARPLFRHPVSEADEPLSARLRHAGPQMRRTGHSASRPTRTFKSDGQRLRSGRRAKQISRQGGPEHRIGGVLVGGDSQKFEGRAIAPARCRRLVTRRQGTKAVEPRLTPRP